MGFTPLLTLLTLMLIAESARGVDGDALPDAVFANNNHGQTCLDPLAVTKIGRCTTPTISTPPFNFVARRVALGHVDADVHLDAVFAQASLSIPGFHGSLVCPGDGTGAFTCDNDLDSAHNFQAVALADLNGDSDLDAVLATTTRNRVCLGDGLGDFTCSDVTADSFFSTGVALGDMDGDNTLDAVFSNAFNFAGQGNQVCFGDGAGGFTSCADVSTDNNPTNDVALGDVNGDGNLDAVFANSPRGITGQNRVCLGDGAGGFISCSDVSSDTDQNFRVALGNVDGDGNLDAVFAGRVNIQSFGPQLCLGNGSGGFTCSRIASDAGTLSVALGDVDLDGNLDAVLGGSDNRMPNQTCLGDGSGGLTCSDISVDTPQSLDVALSVCADGSTPPCIPTAGAPDSDGDGVNDSDDVCSGTVIPESVPTAKLNPNHWALVDGDTNFDTVSKGKGNGPGRSYTTTDTAGCSCEQIIFELGLGQGHTKFGCSISAMDEWVAFVNP